MSKTELNNHAHISESKIGQGFANIQKNVYTIQNLTGKTVMIEYRETALH